MAFSFSPETRLEEISVKITFPQKDPATGEVSDESTVHVFREPTAGELETHSKMMSRVSKGQVNINAQDANLAIWRKCIIRVEGYEGIPEENWKDFFAPTGGKMLGIKDDRPLMHANRAASGLIAIVQGEIDPGN